MGLLQKKFLEHRLHNLNKDSFGPWTFDTKPLTIILQDNSSESIEQVFINKSDKKPGSSAGSGGRPLGPFLYDTSVSAGDDCGYRRSQSEQFPLL